ncbi:LPS export ABC transporter ATP-binding protein [Methylacidimicrobium tartarophylax]|uniref:Lipopolysaccharide export system ATP-binding protein LptB n=1 Tax=Methylacidimicrobium tartarophylax TaxID=1041768 RepID=A0A5E6M631_9BACT|nr:LPS export ABC transporter ATP-binding protein [Methylacidimicrobium tartarophylax]VVM04759.1 Lipopolysaccharide export system ATP-binding protein LptB [Methylacidimicrobium tartarophylax]
MDRSGPDGLRNPAFPAFGSQGPLSIPPWKGPPPRGAGESSSHPPTPEVFEAPPAEEESLPVQSRVLHHSEGEEGDGVFPLSAEGLVKQFGHRRVVNGVDLHVRTGEIVGLLGPNGAGKTTTFYMLVGLIQPTQGDVFIDGQKVTRMPMHLRARKGLGYLPQEESIFRKLTVEENLMAILDFLDVDAEERTARCEALLEDFGIAHLRRTMALALSGGEKRRLTIARALATAPTVLLLDEPFSGVDPLAVDDLQQIVLGLRNRGLSVLISDHNVRETLAIVDRAYLVCEGRVMSHGSSDFLINDPVTRELYLGPRFSM